MRGKVAWFNNAKGYGFISPEGGGTDVFVHYSSIQMEGYRGLKQGDPVEFEIEVGGPHNRTQAIGVTLLGVAHAAAH